MLSFKNTKIHLILCILNIFSTENLLEILKRYTANEYQTALKLNTSNDCNKSINQSNTQQTTTSKAISNQNQKIRLIENSNYVTNRYLHSNLINTEKYINKSYRVDRNLRNTTDTFMLMIEPNQMTNMPLSSYKSQSCLTSHEENQVRSILSKVYTISI